MIKKELCIFFLLGRKKKSAIAKLAEKKRLGSECGSEPGSLVSLQREEPHDKEVKDTIDGKLQQNDKNDLDNFSNGINRSEGQNDINADEAEKVKDLNEKNRNNSSIEATKDSEKANLALTDKEKHPPKPVPRKSSRKKPIENNIEGFEGGTVVSIYEKREQTTKKRNNSLSSTEPRVNSEITNESGVKKELFPNSDVTDKSDGVFSILGPGKPRPGLISLGDLPPLNSSTSQKIENVELSPPVPMDIDLDSDNEDDNKDKPKDDSLLSKNAPSDATVHRFRAMRMTPDRSRSEESLKNAQFTPKPPTTPRSARKTPPKGEKRNRESNSSGEEADIETKKQNSDSAKISDNILNTSLSNLQTVETVKMDVDVGDVKEPVKKGLSIHPDVKEVKDFPGLNVNQNMHADSAEKDFKEAADNDETNQTLLKASNEFGKDSVTDKGNLENSKKSGKKKLGRKHRVSPHRKNILSPLDGSDIQSPGKDSVDTIGSAADLKAISEQYQEVLKADSVTEMSESESVIPEPKNSGKLSPIQPKTLPPPLPHDMKSTALRTTYKTDPKYAMTKFFGRSFSGPNEREKPKFETMSHRSLSSTATLNTITTLEARERYVSLCDVLFLVSQSMLHKQV